MAADILGLKPHDLNPVSREERRGGSEGLREGGREGGIEGGRERRRD